MPAPKGNQYWKFGVDNIGRPKKYETQELLQAKIEEYYQECEREDLPLTIEGLSDHLDVDRVTLLNYGKEEGYEEFFSTIKKAKNKILRYKMEKALKSESNTPVAIFDFKNNYGYVDKTEQATTNRHTIEKTEDLSQLTDEELDTLLALKEKARIKSDHNRSD